MLEFFLVNGFQFVDIFEALSEAEISLTFLH